jgi:hypothetical protein
MTVRKFRTIEEMNAADEERWLPSGDPRLIRRIEALWHEASLLIPPLDIPAGVYKYRSVEEANADRERWEQKRVDALRAVRENKN